MQILNGFGIEVDEKSDEEWILNIPSYRSDIKFPADIIEDIGRMYGYQNVPNRPPVNQLVVPPTNRKIEVVQKVRAALTASGLDEVITYPFFSEVDKETFNLKGLIPIINPQSSDYKYLRSTLLPSLTKVVSLNARYFDHFGIFEVAKKFARPNGDTSSEEPLDEQPMEIETVTAMFFNQRDSSIFELKGAVENVFTALHISNISFSENGTVKINHKKVGEIGLMDSKILHYYGVEYPVSYVELDLASLIENYVEVVQFKPISKFPGTKLDYSVMVPVNLPISEIEKAIPEHPYIVDKTVIDIYKNVKEQNKKSVSLRVFIQKMDENITANDAYDFGVWIENKLKQIPDLEIRGGGVSKPVDYQSTDLNLV
jgi:phenylalanyl-tRNA synthetase beta chain